MPQGEWRAEEDAFLAGERKRLQTRVGEAMGDFIGDLVKPVTLFATLTFDPSNIRLSGPMEGARGEVTEVPAVSTWCARRRFVYFLRHASKACRAPVVGVIAMDFHKLGNPHGHGVLGIEGGLVYPDIEALSLLWRDTRGNGWIRLEEPLSDEDVTRYCAKYMAKDAGDLVFSSALTRP
jgi:hypothetical protein